MTRWRCNLLLLAALAISFLKPALAKEPLCQSPNGFALGVFDSPPSLTIRLFDIDFRPEFDPRVVEGLRVAFARDLQKDLSSVAYFDQVVILAADEESTTDLVLEGAFQNIVLGNNSFSWNNLLTQGAYEHVSSVDVIGHFRRASSTDGLTEFECRVAGKLGSAKGKAKAALRDISGFLGKAFSRRR